MVFLQPDKSEFATIRQKKMFWGGMRTQCQQWARALLPQSSERDWGATNPRAPLAGETPWALQECPQHTTCCAQGAPAGARFFWFSGRVFGLFRFFFVFWGFLILLGFSYVFSGKICCFPHVKHTMRKSTVLLPKSEKHTWASW